MGVAARRAKLRREGRAPPLFRLEVKKPFPSTNVSPPPRVCSVVSAPWNTGAATRALLERAPEEDTTDRLGRLFEAHRDRLFRLACRLCRDREEARDLVQEAFVRAARSARSLPSNPSGEEAWLVRTLVNLCRDRYRWVAVREREWEGLAYTARISSATPSNPADSALLRRAVRAALDRLPPRRRAVAVLCEMEGMEVREVAHLLGLAEVTVRWHRMQARRQLAKELAP